MNRLMLLLSEGRLSEGRKLPGHEAGMSSEKNASALLDPPHLSSPISVRHLSYNVWSHFTFGSYDLHRNDPSVPATNNPGRSIALWNKPQLSARGLAIGREPPLATM